MHIENPDHLETGFLTHRGMIIDRWQRIALKRAVYFSPVATPWVNADNTPQRPEKGSLKATTKN